MFLEKNECDVAECKSAEEALAFLDKGIYDMVVSEYHRLHGKDGLWLLNRIRKEFPETRVVLMSAYADATVAVQAMKDGASDFISKPFTPPTFISRCNEALSNVPGRVPTSQQAPVKMHDFNDFVGRSYTVKRAKDLIRMSVGLPKSLLLSGDTGTGKEAVAKEIHRQSCGDTAPFVRVSCEASEEAELEQDLFASDGGLLLAADGGTIFSTK